LFVKKFVLNYILEAEKEEKKEIIISLLY